MGIKRALVLLVKSKREELGLSQYALSEASGVSREAISRFELGTQNFTLNTAEKIFKALGVTAFDFGRFIGSMSIDN